MNPSYSTRVYQHSGKLGFSPLLLAAAGIPLIVVLSALYSYLDLYIPLTGYITVILLAGYGLGLSFVVSTLVKRGNCRNEKAVLAFSLAAGIIGLYSSWVIFMYALFARFSPDEHISFFELLNPLFLWSTILFVNENGWYTISGGTPSGITLWILWAIEAAVIIGFPLFVATSAISHEMFCENCQTWCLPTASKYRQIPATIESGKIKNVDTTTLSSLTELEQKKFPCIKEELLSCPNCNKTKGNRYSRLVLKQNGKKGLVESADKIKGIVYANNF